MWILWDVISVAVLGLCVYLGARRGFVRTLISLLCYIGAVLLAQHFGPILAEFVYDKLFSGWMVTTLTEIISQVVQEGTANVLPEIIESLPLWVGGLLLSVYPEAASATLGEFVSSAEGQLQIEELAIQLEQAISPPVLQFLGWVFFLILFVILVILIKIIAQIFTGVNYIPMVGTVNMTFGGILGAVQGLIILLAIAVIVPMISVLLASDIPFIQPETVQSSFIMGSIYQFVFG